MTTTHRKDFLAADLSAVWDAVQTVEQYPAWRSDVSRVEVLRAGQFREYTKDGFATTFTVTALEPRKRWEFDMENDSLQGHWTGLFAGRDGGTELDFTEAVTVKRWYLHPLVKFYLKRQQAQFTADLQRYLGL